MSGMTALGIIVAHLCGDYLLQSHWMATEKVKRWWPAIVHGFCYTLAYVFVTQSIPALLVIWSTHSIIDRYRLAKHVGYLKNLLAPSGRKVSFSDAMANGGYDRATPLWMATFLMITTDNTIHLLINSLAVLYL